MTLTTKAEARDTLFLSFLVPCFGCAVMMVGAGWWLGALCNVCGVWFDVGGHGDPVSTGGFCAGVSGCFWVSRFLR